ncbi:MAG TPA: CCA tRNA nucleotidyltransferase, partial [Vicinamibacterales bacterium]
MTEAACRLDARWLREKPLAQLLAVLGRDGEEARVVGGAVRNTLLAEPHGDIDIATTAVPDEVIRRVEAAGFKAVPTGIEHGTVTVIVGGHPFEVTTLREDVETFGRHAKVAFGRDWQRDAERRDFTMNALSVGPDGTLYDYVGGLGDLKARRVRFIGDARTRIAEDSLRILRFFRFHAVYGRGLPDAEGVHACIAGRAGLEQLSRERVRMEMLKLLLAVHAVPTLAVMTETGLLETVLGGVPHLASTSNMIKLEHALGLPADAVRRLGALGVAVTEDAERLRDRLRLSNHEYERLHSVADGWWRINAQWDERQGRVLLYRLRRERYTDRVLLAWSRADEGVADPRWRALATLPERWTAPVFPLKAADFLARGLAKGPALGAAMRA